MYKCEKCNKGFDSERKLSGHKASHSRGETYRLSRQTEQSKKRHERQLKKEHKCRFCEKEFNTGPMLGSHVRMCKQNPLYASRLSTAKTKRKLFSDNKEWKEIQNKKTSETIKRKVQEGTWHYSFSKVRTHEYKGVKLHGTWELQYAKWLDENNIKWRRPKEKFAFSFENKEKFYTPDFYLIDSNEYIEIKGYETNKDRAKWKDFPLKLRVIKGKELFQLNIITEDQLKGKK